MVCLDSIKLIAISIRLSTNNAHRKGIHEEMLVCVVRRTKVLRPTDSICRKMRSAQDRT